MPRRQGVVTSLDSSRSMSSGSPVTMKQMWYTDLCKRPGVSRTAFTSAMNGLLDTSHLNTQRPHTGSTKQSTGTWVEHQPAMVWPALIKDSLQTGASHWAHFWNGFLFIPRDTSRSEGGGSCSIDQSVIDSASGFDKLLGWVESLG